MWRWNSPSSSIHSNLGVGLSDLIQGNVAFLAGGILTVANFAWQIAAYLIDWVTNPQNNLAANGSLLGSVNNFVANIGGSLINGPAPWIVLAAALLFLAVGYMRGKLSVKSGIRSVICLTLLTIMVSAAGSSNPDNTTLSPSWTITKGVGISNSLASGFSGMVQSVHQHFTTLGTGVPAPNCGQYVAALEQQAQANGAPAVDVGMSDLWDQAFLAQWIRVQFGVDGEGFKASCHYLDNAADPGTVNASNSVQSQIGQAAGYPAGPAPQTGGVYGPWQDDDSMMRGMIAWAWCDSGNGFHTDPDFAAVEQSRGGDGKECQQWWTQTDSSGHPLSGQTNKINTTKDSNGVFDNHSFPGSGYAHTFVAWFDGHFTFVAVILALCALLAALGYGWLFAGLALVVVLSQLGLVVLLFLAPVLLLVMAWPGEGAGKVPGSVGRVFGLCLAAKALFSLLLAGLISLFELLSDLGGAVNYGSTTSAIFMAVMPLLAIFIAHKVAKKFGVNNLLSPIGAFKAAGNAGTWANKKMGGGGGMSGLGSRGGQGSQPKSSSDPSAAKDRPAGKSSGIAATTDRIRNRTGADDDMESDAAIEARKKAFTAAHAPDTSGPPGSMAARQGIGIQPPRPRRPEEIRVWNQGDGQAARPLEHAVAVANGYHALAAEEAANGGPPSGGRGNEFLRESRLDAAGKMPESVKREAVIVFSRDERGPGAVIRDPLADQ